MDTMTRDLKRHLDGRYFRGLYQCSKDAMALASPDGTLLDVNEAFSRLTGYSMEDLLGKKKYQDLTPSTYHSYEADMVAGILKTGEAAEYEKEYIRSDGSRVPILLTSFLVRGDDGTPMGLAAIIRDIAERKAAEIALRESRERLRDLANSLPQTIFELDADGRITFTNRKASDYFGYTRDDFFAGLSVFQMLVAEDHGKLRDMIRRTIAGEQVGPGEYTALRKDGSTFPMLVYSTPLLRGDRPVGVRGIAIDISERKRIQKDLEDSHERYRDLFEYASDAMLIRDLAGNIVQANEVMSTLTGYTVEELTSMNISRFLSTEYFDAAIRNQEGQVRGEATVRRYELEIIRKDGGRRAIESMTRLVADKGEAPVLQVIARDVTEQKRLRENLQFYIGQAITAQEEERKRIARELHDETAQSLACLLLDIEGIERARVRSPEEVPRLLSELRARTDTILEGVRRFSHALRPDVLDQLGLLPALDLLAGEAGKESKIAVTVETTGVERRLAPEKELVLFRIAQEALHNVARHSGATEAAIRVEFGGQGVRLSIADNGHGFELPEAIGDLAARGKLGLAGMHERTRLVGGTLSLKSEPSGGTAVTVEIPG